MNAMTDKARVEQILKDLNTSGQSAKQTEETLESLIARLAALELLWSL
jgi:chorismate mutase